MYRKRYFAFILILTLVLSFMPAGLFTEVAEAADVNEVHLKDGQLFSITDSPKNTIVYIDDNTASRNNRGEVTLMGSSDRVWVHIAVSRGKTVIVNLADGLNIKPGSDSARGTGASDDSLGHSRSGIYIDETKDAGGIVLLRSKKNATINIDSYCAWFYRALPAIMKNDTKTKLIFDTEDPDNPGTIIANPTSGKVTGAAGIGAFGHGSLAHTYNSYTVGNIEFKAGNIKAYGLNDGPAIGAYEMSNIGRIDFTGANVLAKADAVDAKFVSAAAGIGTNYGGDIDEINIYKGRVEAWGRGALPSMKYNVDNGGPGIGVGMYGHFNEINILGGTVIAHGGTDAQDSGDYSGCGIGTCLVRSDFGRSTGDKINITGGDITAVGGDYTCGIGGCVGEINIEPDSPDTELKIDASIDQKTGSAGRKHYLGSGIGIGNNIGNGNFSKYPGNITIKGGDITASGGTLGLHGLYEDGDHFYGAGIGPTYHGRVSLIDISGGKITANGGWNSPGIGGNNERLGNNGSVESINISGGTITATKACENTKGGDASLSGIGGYKADNNRTTIVITGGNVISNGNNQPVGFDPDGRPKNYAGQTLDRMIFRYDPDVDEWTKVDSFTTDSDLGYDYGLNDVFAKKGLDDEEDMTVTEFWLPVNSPDPGYISKVVMADHRYSCFKNGYEPDKAVFDRENKMLAYTDIDYISNKAGYKYKGKGIGVYGEGFLSIDPQPADNSMYEVTGFGTNGLLVANKGIEDHTGSLVQGKYADYDLTWKAICQELTLTVLLNQKEYEVAYDKNKPANAGHDVSGTMYISTFPVDRPDTLHENEYSLAGWNFKGWNTKADGSGTSFSDKDEIRFRPDWGEKLTLYAQWEEKTYTVTFKSGAAGIAQDHTQTQIKYDTSYTLDTISDIGWNYAGHMFHGWSTNAFGSFYDDGAAFCNLVENDSNGDPLLDGEGNLKGLTLTADWVGNGSIRVSASVDGKLKDVTNTMYILKVNGTDTDRVDLTDNGNGRYEASLAGMPEGEYQLFMESDTYQIPPDKQNIGVINDQSSVSVVLNYYTITMNADDHVASAFVKETGTSDPYTSMEAADGTTVVIGASADPGYHFDGYSASGVLPDDFEQLDPDKPDQSITIKGKVDITAHAAANVYHVKFDKNKPANASHDVEGEMEDQDFVYDEPQDLRGSEYTLTGWTFTGWNTAADGSGTPYADEENVSNLTAGGEVTLYAQWEQKQYLIYFSASDATSGTMEPQAVKYDDPPVALKANAFRRTDWHFTGWNTEPAGGGQAFEDGQEIRNLSAGRSITLFAQWEHDYYTVKFDKNDDFATGEMPDEKVWTNCGYELPLCNFIKNGYTFVSWNTEADGSGAACENGEAVENLAPKDGTITLYAQWKQNHYIVRYDANEGKGTMTDQEFVYDEPQNLYANVFTREHYGFTGWNTIPDGTGKAYGNGENVKNLTIAPDDVVTLYAQWEIDKHTISLDLNGGTLDGKTGTVRIVAKYGDTIIMPKPVREGYTFSYWKGSRYKAGAKYAVTGDHSLTAIWKKNGGAKTGDDNQIAAWLIMLVSAAAALAGMGIRRVMHRK